MVPPVLERDLRKSEAASGGESDNSSTNQRWLNSFLNVSFHQSPTPYSPGSALQAPFQPPVISGLREL